MRGELLANKKKQKTNFLGDVSPDKCFWVCDGKTLKSMAELSEALKGISSETFAYHVNPEKNDFYKWVSDVIEDKKLAAGIKGAKSKEAMLKKVIARLQELKP